MDIQAYVVLFLNILHMRFPDSSVGRESTCNAGDPGLIPGSGRSSGEGIGYSLQYFFGAQRSSEFTFLPGLLRPSQEGALCLYPIERAPEASMNRASPVSGALLAFCLNQGISAAFSPLLSYHRLRTTRFRPIKGPQHKV